MASGGGDEISHIFMSIPRKKSGLLASSYEGREYFIKSNDDLQEVANELNSRYLENEKIDLEVINFESESLNINDRMCLRTSAIVYTSDLKELLQEIDGRKIYHKGYTDWYKLKLTKADSYYVEIIDFLCLVVSSRDLFTKKTRMTVFRITIREVSVNEMGESDLNETADEFINNWDYK